MDRLTICTRNSSRRFAAKLTNWQEFDPVTALTPQEAVIPLGRTARDAYDESFFE